MKHQHFPILFCGYLVFYANAEPTGLLHVIRALNAKINADTTLFYTNTQSSLEFQEVVQQQLPPKILASAKAATQLDLYNSKVLAVVFLGHNLMEELQQLHALLHTNRRITHIFVLFVAYGYEDQRGLFEWCWQQKLLYVLLSTVDNATTFTTYTPFPRLQLVNTTLSKYFDKHYAQTNFKGYPLRFDGGINLPRSLIVDNKQGKVMLNGFLPRLIQLFAAVYNATLQRIRTSEEYNIHECMRMIAQERLDLCTEFYFIGGQIRLTKPLYLYEIHLLVPCAQKLPLFRYFAAPFTLQLWLLLAFTLIWLTVILAFMCWWAYNRWCMGQLFIDLIACLLFIPFRLRPFAGYTQRLLYVMLVIIGYMLSSCYLALLSSMFSVNIDEEEIKNLSDLKQRNITVTINELDVALLHSYNASQDLFERIQSVTFDKLTTNMLALDTRYAYLCADDKCYVLLNQQKHMLRCRMRIIRPPIMTVWAGIVIGNNTIFEDILNVYLQHVFETGIFMHLQLQSHEDAMRMNITKYFRTEDANTAKALLLNYFDVPGRVLIVGYALSLMAFLSELVKYHYWK